jgi:serine protease Do
MKSFAGVAVFLFTLAQGLLWAGQMTPEEKRALESKPAIVLVKVDLKVRWFPGTAYSVVIPERETGTGFIFRPDGYLLTNGHVVADANLNNNQAMDALKERLTKQFVDEWKRGSVIKYFEKKFGKELTESEQALLLRELIDQKSLPAIDEPPELHVYMQNGKELKADILQFSLPYDLGGKDVAVLKIPGNDLPTVPLGNSDNVRLQDSIMVMGYPGVASNWGGSSASDIISEESNLEPSATNGHISALKTESIGTPLLQSDVAITHGNSGGPAFNERGEVIGLATYGSTEAAGFNFLVPINTAWEFVRESGAVPQTGGFDQHWKEALSLYDEGKCNQAIAEFDNVMQFMPGLRDAQKYRGDAVACVDRMSWFQKTMEGNGKWPIAGLLALVLLGGGFWLVAGRGGAKVVPVAAGTAKPPVIVPAVLSASPSAPALAGGFGRIQFSSGSLAGKSFLVTKDGVWIGRDATTCAVVVADDSVSSRHAWVVPADGAVMVIDKDSTNGTYLNSTDSPRISKVALRNGDRVFLGQKGAVFTYFAG